MSALDEPAAAKPSRALVWCGALLAALCGLNLLLFRLDGLDWLFCVVAALAAACFAVARRGGRLLALRGPLLLLSAPFLLAGLFLVYQMVLGTYAGLTARPVPESLAWKAATLEEARALDALMEKYPKDAYEGKPRTPAEKDLRDAIVTLSVAATSLVDAKEPLTPEQAFSGPGFVEALAEASPYLDEQLNQEAASPVAPDDKYLAENAPRLSFLQSRHATQANMARVLDLARLDRRPEAQDLYLRMLRARTNSLAPGNNLPQVMMQVALLKYMLEFQHNFAPGLMTGREEETREVLSRANALLPKAFEGAMKFELAFVGKALREARNTPRALKMHEAVSVRDEPVEFLNNALLARSGHWPLSVNADTEGSLGAWMETLVDYTRLPLDEAVQKMEEHSEQYAIAHSGPAAFFQPNPVGRLMAGIAMPSYTQVYSKVILTRSMVQADDYLLSWSQAPSGSGTGAVPMDPGTNAPYHTSLQPLAEGSGEKLVLGGGNVDLHGPGYRRSEARLKEFGLADRAMYIFTATRPAKSTL
jgi:hypothetical protein